MQDLTPVPHRTRKIYRHLLSGTNMQNRIHLGLSVTALALLTAGCAASIETRVALVRPDSKALSFKFTDNRPAQERIAREEPNLKKLGDSNFETPPAEYIAAYLQSKLGARLAGRDVTLDGLEDNFMTFYGVRGTFGPLPAGTSPLLGVAVTTLLPPPPDHQIAHVDLHGQVDRLRFSGGETVGFKFGSGRDEMQAAFEGAMKDVVRNLEKALDAETQGGAPQASQ